MDGQQGPAVFPQATASDSDRSSMTCPKCGTSYIELSQEMKANYQPASSHQDQTFKKETQTDLKKPKNVMSKSGNSPSSSSHSGYRVKVSSVVTGRTFGADDVILEQVMKSTSLTVEATDQQKCNIIIVFCPITSRVGSDVDAAMRDIPGDKSVLLVLMYHTRDVDYSTDGKRWSEIYPNVVLDVHVLFHQTLQGLLKCPRNDQAVRQIQKELHNHSEHKGSSGLNKSSGLFSWFRGNNQQQE